MTTKADIINGAYSQLRISGLTVDPTSEDIRVALRRLESMMGELEYSRNICVGYNFEVTPDINSVTNVILPYWPMMEANLALRLIPDFNKPVPQTLLDQASQTMEAASAAYASRSVREVQYPDRQPIGSGTQYRYSRFQRFYHVDQLPPNECATNSIVIDDVNDYVESWRAYLDASEDIASFTTTVDPGLTLVSSTNNTPVINYTIQANSIPQSGQWQQVKFVITTTNNRVDTRFVNFEILSNRTVNLNS